MPRTFIQDRGLVFHIGTRRGALLSLSGHVLCYTTHFLHGSRNFVDAANLFFALR